MPKVAQFSLVSRKEFRLGPGGDDCGRSAVQCRRRMRMESLVSSTPGRAAMVFTKILVDVRPTQGGKALFGS